MSYVKENINDCCGCGLCKEACPVDAIKMDFNDNGFYVPVIDDKKCIQCNRCRTVCIFNQDHIFNKPIETYAAIRKNKKKLMNSSSGGVFAAIAEKVLIEGGYICGAIIEDDFNVKHIVSNKDSDLQKMLGSKYVQSDISEIFRPIKELLNNNEIVLFSGTPCQVDAIKQYTSNPDNLFTIEIICHGVTPIESYKLYMKHLMIKNKLEEQDISEFKFRDKRQGWSFNNSIKLKNGKDIRINHRLSSYMTFYLQGSLYRDSCFVCPYAKDERNADLTIGDYWGVVRKEKDLSEINIDEGVSCCLLNSDKGKKLIKDTDLILYKVDYKHIKEGNGPLNEPSVKPNNRDELMRWWKIAFKNNEWGVLENYFKNNYLKFSYYIWAYLPSSIRHLIRVALKIR